MHSLFPRRLVKDMADGARSLVPHPLKRGWRLVTRRNTPTFDRTPFSHLTYGTGSRVPLWLGYRDHVKGRWRGTFWPVAVLFELQRRVAIPSNLGLLAEEIQRARTLPVPLAEILEAVQAAAERYPTIVRQTQEWDPALGCARMSIIPRDDQIRRRTEGYRDLAQRILASTGYGRRSASGARVLEQGCGTGIATLAFASIGAQAIGVDIGRAGDDSDRELLSHGFFGSDKPPVSFEQGDAQSLPFAKQSFDLVHSASVVEHIPDPPAAFREAFRILKPGGHAYFDVDPWFGPAGGHSLCTLDFPWGHVRLSGEEFESYIKLHRPHEWNDALGFYRKGFQRPRLTLNQLRQAVLQAGFEIRRWTESPTTLDTHRALLKPDVLEDARRRHPGLTRRDLMTSGLTMVLRRP